MIGSRWLLVMGVALGLGASMAWGVGSTPVQSDEAAADETPLHENMVVMEDCLKKLRRGLRKPEKNEESLQLIVDMTNASIICKDLIPKMAENKPEAERPAFIKAYRKRMCESIIDMFLMEIAVLDGDNEKAQELYKKLKIHEDEGHEEFTEDG